MWRQEEQMDICEPRRQTSQDIKPTDTLVSDSQRIEPWDSFPSFELVCGTLLWQLELTNTAYLHSPISSHFSDINSRVQIGHTDSLLRWLWGILFPEPVLFKVSLDRGREGRATHLRRCFSSGSIVLPEETAWFPKVRPKRMVTSTHSLASSTSDPSLHSFLVTSLECTDWMSTDQTTHQRNSQFSVPVPTLCEMFQHLRFCGEFHNAAVAFKFQLCSNPPGWARAPHIPRIALNKLGREDDCRDDSAGNTLVGPAQLYKAALAEAVL